MRRQATYITMLAVLLLAAACSAQGPARPGTARISGRVVSFDGRPLENVRVDLRDLPAGSSVQSVFTNVAGQFQIGNVAPGKYLIVATLGLEEASERIEISRMFAFQVTLRLPPSASGTSAGDNNTVSVQQMKVPGNARSALRRAQEALAKGRSDEALEEVNRALALHPRYAEALMLRGAMKLDKNDPTQACSDMEEAVKVDPGYAMGYIGLGAAFNARSLFDDALRVIERGVALSPMAWQGYYEMGGAYFGKNDFQAALRQLNKAEEFVPQNYAPLRYFKAQVLLELKRYDQAADELQSYLTLNPGGRTPKMHAMCWAKYRHSWRGTASKG